MVHDAIVQDLYILFLLILRSNKGNDAWLTHKGPLKKGLLHEQSVKNSVRLFPDQPEWHQYGSYREVAMCAGMWPELIPQSVVRNRRPFAKDDECSDSDPPAYPGHSKSSSGVHQARMFQQLDFCIGRLCTQRICHKSSICSRPTITADDGLQHQVGRKYESLAYRLACTFHTGACPCRNAYISQQ